MKWNENLISISRAGNPGACPHCGSTKTDYMCNIVDPEKKLGYMDVWCDNCKKAFHVSRMEITDNLKTGGSIPGGLKY